MDTGFGNMIRRVEVPEVTKAWAAGFWEGEGSITIAKRASKRYPLRPVYRLRVKAGQRKVEPLQILYDNWGGSLRPRRARESFDWSISCNMAIKFLRDIYPYLKFRHDQVDTGLELYNHVGCQGQLVSKEQMEKREVTREKLLELNGYYRRKHGNS